MFGVELEDQLDVREGNKWKIQEREEDEISAK